jgi:Zn-dependent protease
VWRGLRLPTRERGPSRVDFLLGRIPWLVMLWLSLTVHEWAHARVAWALGDGTARSQGRMTLDPFAHIDPVGTFLLPLVGIPFGWAKPVPINPAAFDRRFPMSFGMLLCAVAGPVSNLLLALLGIGAVGLVAAFVPVEAANRVLPWLMLLVNLNVALAVFNLIPVPPLDGSRVVAHFLPRSVRGAWEAVERYGTFLPFAVLVVLTTLGLSPIEPAFRVSEALMGWVLGLVRG